MWPAPSHSSSVEPSISSCSLRLCSIGVSLSLVPQMIATGTLLIACTVSNLSSVPKVGKKSATTPNGVAESISSTNSTYLAGTASPNASSSVATSATERPILRNRSTVRCPRASAATSRAGELAADGRGQQRHARCGAGRCRRPWSPTRPTPTTRSPNSSGCSSASATIGHAAHRVPDEHDRTVGHGLVEHAQQVLAELLDGGVVLVERPDRPCERWS